MFLRSMAVAFVLTVAALAQSVDAGPLHTYTSAIKALPGQRVSQLEAFLKAEPRSSLAPDALAWLTWSEVELGDRPAAAAYGHRLLADDSGSPLGLAATLNAPRSPADKPALRAVVGQARAALSRLDQLRRPEGMSDATLETMKRQVAGMLDGAAGIALWRLADFDSARVYLAYALQVFPDNATYMYALGVSELDSKPRDSGEAYWYLARAVNLSHSGDIETYAYNRYAGDGGTAEQWKQFLASTAPPGARYVAPAAPVRIAGARPAAHRALDVPPLPAAPAAASEPAGPLVIPAEERAARAGEPISLGILIETSLTNKSDRDAVVFALGDMLRRLGRDDEAFVLSYSNELVFQQDLTGNPDALENALKAVKPQSGAALLEAVGFACGHLQRIARNRNRVLLVISDGRNSRAQWTSSFEAEGQIDSSSVRIYTIGIGVDDAAARSRLEALATRTGGRAAFVPRSSGFRVAARQVAQTLGLDFPM